MARRVRNPFLSPALLRSFNALTRATVRAGKRAVTQARKRLPTPAVPRRKAAPPLAGDWTTGIAITPLGARRYRLYKPPGARKSAPLPLLVMLHGCSQDAEHFARSTRLDRLAARERFFVLYAEQERLANPQGCWNWFETRSGRAYGEAATIVAAIDQVCTLYAADPARVAVAGLSAGASMAALVAARYPQRFKAVAMHSGVVPGAAHSSATAVGAMQGQHKPPSVSIPTGGAALPPLLVIQGGADHIVRPGNGRVAAQSWADAAGAQAVAPRSLQRGARYPMTVTDFRIGTRTVASLCEIDGLGHAWSGGATGQAYSDAKGPSASRMIWAFAAQQFRAVV